MKRILVAFKELDMKFNIQRTATGTGYYLAYILPELKSNKIPLDLITHFGY